MFDSADQSLFEGRKLLFSLKRWGVAFPMIECRMMTETSIALPIFIYAHVSRSIFILQKKKVHLDFNRTSETVFVASHLLIKNSNAPSGVLLLGRQPLLGPTRIKQDLTHLRKTLVLLLTGRSRALVWSWHSWVSPACPRHQTLWLLPTFSGFHVQALDVAFYGSSRCFFTEMQMTAFIRYQPGDNMHYDMTWQRAALIACVSWVCVGNVTHQKEVLSCRNV